MSRNVDSELMEALRKAILKAGSQAELARRTGVSQGNLAKYLSGEIHNMADQTFAKLEPYLVFGEQGKELKTSPLSKSLVVLFEQLKGREQLEVITMVGNIVNEQTEEKRGGELLMNESEKLESRGVTVRKDVMGRVITFNTDGLCWLYNSILYKKQAGKKLTPALFREMLKSEPGEKEARELRIRVFRVESYENSVFQFAIYLNGTPPQLYTTGLINAIGEKIDILRDFDSVFKLSDDSVAELKLTADQVKELKDGKTLKIKYKG